jgi:N utilization substance protein B
MQILYESDMTGHSTSEILVRTRGQGGTPDETLDYASYLLTGIRAQDRNIVALIEDAAPDYPISGLAPIDAALLKIGVFETRYADDVPLRAAVNEVVDIAREYGGDNSSRFINGVLGTLIDQQDVDRRRDSE